MPKTLLTILPVFWPKMPPLGIGYLQSYAEAQGITVDICDLNNFYYNLADKELKKSWLVSSNEQLSQNIFSIMKDYFSLQYEGMMERFLAYDVIGFSCFKSNMPATLEIVRVLKTQKKDIRIILGGPEITRQFFKTKGEFFPELIMLSDFLVVGEGERSLCDYLLGKQDRRVSMFCELESLESLFFPKYRGIDFQNYPRKNAIQIQFCRGCIRQCRFCSERLLYKKFRTRRVEDVIEEIRFYRGNIDICKTNNTNCHARPRLEHSRAGSVRHPVEYFVFCDSLINGDLKKLEELCDAIIKNFGSINWEAQFLVRDDISDELLGKIKKSGCYNLFIGLESGCGRTLKNMNKGFTSQDAQKLFVELNKTRLTFGVSLIVGFPGETEEDFKESMDFIIRNKDVIPKIEQINPFTYYDGTDADKNFDYKLCPDSVRRMEVFVEEIKKHNFKYTNAFIGNLIEK